MPKTDQHGVYAGKRYVKFLDRLPHYYRHGRVAQTEIREVGGGAKLYRDTYEAQVTPPVLDRAGVLRVLDGGAYAETPCAAEDR